MHCRENDKQLHLAGHVTLFNMQNISSSPSGQSFAALH